MSLLDGIIGTSGEGLSVISNLQTQVAAQQTLLAAQQSIVTTLQTTVETFTSAQAVVDALQQAAIDAQAAVDTAQAAALAAQESSNSIQASDIAALQASIASLQASIDALQTTTANLQVADGINASNITAVSNALDAHEGSGGVAAHALATTLVPGFLSVQQCELLNNLFPGQTSSVGIVSARSLHSPPNVPTQQDAGGGAKYATLDTHSYNDFYVQLSSDFQAFFAGASPGYQGTLAVRQDATGGRSVTFYGSTGVTVLRDSNTADLTPAQDPNALTLYPYLVLDSGTGELVVFIGKLTPVAVS